MFTKRNSQEARKRRHLRIRSRLQGTAERPRLAVFRSLKHMYVQVIDDSRGHTLAAASTLDPALRGELGSLAKRDEAARVGRLIAERAKAAGVTSVVFDRAGYLFHGRVKQLADAAREGGLTF